MMKMNIKRYVVGFIMLLVFAFGISSPVCAASRSASVTARVNNKENNKCLKELNALRKKKGLPALKIDKTLQKAAELRAAELTVRYSHERPNGKMPVSITKKVAAENIAMGFGHAEDVCEAWKNSPGHYRNMVHTDMKSIGICCLEYQGSKYWVNVFGKERAKTVKLSGTKTKTFKVSIADKFLRPSRISLIGSQTMSSGEKRTLRISVSYPDDEPRGLLPNSFFTFKSSNPRVLKVNKKGVVTSVKEGAAKITVQSKKYKKLKKSFRIVVEDGSGLVYRDYSDD